MQRFTQLLVWQRDHALALAVYRLASRFPGDEKFGLTSQLRRAALSAPTNVAEGSKRISRQDHARFLNIAECSLAETEYLLMVSRDLEYATAQEIESHQREATEIASMLCSIRAKVSRAK